MHEHEAGVEVLTIDEMLDGLEAVTEEWLTQGTDAGVAYWIWATSKESSDSRGATVG